MKARPLLQNFLYQEPNQSFASSRFFPRFFWTSHVVGQRQAAQVQFVNSQTMTSFLCAGLYLNFNMTLSQQTALTYDRFLIKLRFAHVVFPRKNSKLLLFVRMFGCAIVWGRMRSCRYPWMRSTPKAKCRCCG